MQHLKENQQQQQSTKESTNITVIQDGQTPPAIPTNEAKPRVVTLDVFRGLTIAVMILVDDAGGEWPHITHAPWNGCNLADFVMPFFLFIVGVAIALAFKRISEIAPAIKKVVVRTLKLLFWGILLQGGYSHAPDDLSYGVNMKKIRWCGILQRIALAYLVVSLVEITTIKKRPTTLPPERFAIFKLYIWNWLFGLCVFLIYFATTYGLYVPDWHFIVHDEDSPYNGKLFTVKCGVRGHLDPPCNAVGYVDRQVWGINHVYHHPAWRRSKYCTKSSPGEGPLRSDAPAWCWAPFEPEGLLSSISAILTSIIGVHYGHVLIHFKGNTQRLKHWVTMGFGFLILGIILHYTDAIPLNKQLYSFSYVCLTAGAAGLVFSAFYLLIDIWGLRRPFLLLEWMGMNAMLIFVMAAEGIFPAFVNGWYYDTPNNTLESYEEADDFSRRTNQNIELNQDRDEVQHKLRQYHNKMKILFDRKSRESDFKQGDLVLSWDARREARGKHGKFYSLWLGPFTIIEVKGNNTLILQNLEGEYSSLRVNGQYLKNYI